ncbi:MAG: phospho-N-acetylmuramoyl-pentapeptide-transferase [Clostridia bacterium]|nr:phospho-N-acetylmuramoyl-pentapeptide-transferase [Clostridia bacterium]
MYLIEAFAMVCAMAVVFLVMPKFLPFLKKLKFGQTIYDLGPQAHLAKQGTPNMGGIVTALATVLVTVVFTVILGIKRGWTFGLSNALWPLLFITVGCMALFGFPDDYIKDVKKDHEGLKPKQKLIGQMVIGLAFSFFCYQKLGSDVIIPFTSLTWDLGIFYIPIMTVLVMFITNSANLQDGVDGLLSSVTVVGMIAFGLIASFLGVSMAKSYSLDVVTTIEKTFDCAPKDLGFYFSWFPPISILCFALAGASIGFLRYNRHPAKIFMGDTGSMFIGGAMVGVAMLTKTQFLLIPIAFTCIMSSVSVMLQRGYFKYTKKKYGEGRRIFKMSPLHHHFELCGMKENQIVLMYAAVTLVLSLLAVLSMWAYY